MVQVMETWFVAQAICSPGGAAKRIDDPPSCMATEGTTVWIRWWLRGDQSFFAGLGDFRQTGRTRQCKKVDAKVMET